MQCVGSISSFRRISIKIYIHASGKVLLFVLVTRHLRCAARGLILTLMVFDGTWCLESSKRGLSRGNIITLCILLSLGVVIIVVLCVLAIRFK